MSIFSNLFIIASLWSRGNLLQLSHQHGVSLWPSEIKDFKEILEIFLHDGKDTLQNDKFSRILLKIMRIDEEIKATSEIGRILTSAALFIAISTHHAKQHDNHFAIISAWIIFITHAIATIEKNKRGSIKNLFTSISLAETFVKDNLVALWNELNDSKTLSIGNPFADRPIIQWRRQLIDGLLCCLWFFPETSAEDKTRNTLIKNRILTNSYKINFWGEGAVPTILARIFLLRRCDPTKNPDILLSDLMKFNILKNSKSSESPLADPYYDFQEILAASIDVPINEKSRQLKRDHFSGLSNTSELLLHLTAKARYKTPCRVAWPTFTSIINRSVTFTEKWHYCLYHSTNGTEKLFQYPETYTWKKLCDDSESIVLSDIPEFFINKPHLLMLWTIIAPHRLTPNIGKFLSDKLRR